MNDSISGGFLEQPHTADWELEVWAPDFPGLLAKAAEGMYSLMALQPDLDCLQERRLDLEAVDREGMLVAFLSELLYLTESENLYCRPVKITIQDNHLQASLLCSGISARGKEIKAVTWHNLEVRQSGDLLRTVIVFDV